MSNKYLTEICDLWYNKIRIKIQIKIKRRNENES